MVDLKDQALEESVVVAHGKPILVIMVRTMKGMAGGMVAIRAHGECLAKC
ncbi:hypothetical protein GCM10027512_03350 [Chromohalobacter beijerinckii]